ncbi:hypothetical protein ACBY01_03820 [Sphingomonas sp. ac-8]|uniref:hypothetical protein n=1 Tax=Sphingomonas sp. ac-8 TaxID=3242977 RepID=UPI003A7FD5EF
MLVAAISMLMFVASPASAQFVGGHPAPDAPASATRYRPVPGPVAKRPQAQRQPSRYERAVAVWEKKRERCLRKKRSCRDPHPNYADYVIVPSVR